MNEVNIKEISALKELSEVISEISSLSVSCRSNSAIDRKTIIDLSHRFNIKIDKALGRDPPPQTKLKREDVFNFLIQVYSKYPQHFPKLMEELLQRCFLTFREIIPIEQPDFKSLFEKNKNMCISALKNLGYKMIITDDKTPDIIKVSLIKNEITEGKREVERLYIILEENFINEYLSICGAYESYLKGGTDAYRQAIGSCRNAYENFFKKITKAEKWKDKLKESGINETLVKLIKEIYNTLSGLGPHSGEPPPEEDALLAIKLTETIMIYVLMKKEMWEKEQDITTPK